MLGGLGGSAMRLFFYLGHDGPRGEELRKTLRQRHLDHLRGLADAGRIRFAGPLVDESGGPCGSLVIFEADDLAAARAVAEADPYTTDGVFERLEIRATKAVLP
jgi:uncharacterized protein YciI